MERYICIHGHFYQPPRHNPWLDAIEFQPSAQPYANWNSRITAECYAPNATARILNGANQIVHIINNYARMSFNVGPTLLAWMEQQAPEVYAAILAADQESQQRFAGHGSALAQAYNHLIMPLAHRRDKQTQIVWGLRDFTHRFRRQPEGMWLPETAVDLETLDLLAVYGVRFTILAPHQAARVRRRDSTTWDTVSGGHIDSTMPYVQRLPSGRQIVIFFYHGPLSRGIAFNRLLDNGLHFAQQLMAALRPDAAHAQLLHVATDGETYGHHHRFGEMALAYALNYLETQAPVHLTNYGAYLERYPPTHEVEIHENTSWSCAHGIERWRSHCGCHTGGPDTWRQTWRTPLRAAMDTLRDTLAPAYAQQTRQRLLRDPWAARDDYITVLLNRTPSTMADFVQRHAGHALTPDATVRLWQWLEMQHQAMLMYTSCGWFFDDISGLEPRQVLLHAGQVVQLACQLGLDASLETAFLDRLAQASSNLPAEGDGRQVYERWVRPAMVRWEHLAVQYAMHLLCSAAAPPERLYCYSVHLMAQQRFATHEAACVIGHARLTSEITQASALLYFAAVHRGEHHLYGGARIVEHVSVEDQTLPQEIRTACAQADVAAIIRTLHAHFGATAWSLRGLRPDAQRQLVTQLLDAIQRTTEMAYRQMYEPRLSLMQTLTRLYVPAPATLQHAAAVLSTLDLCRLLEAETLDLTQLRALLEHSRAAHLALDVTAIQASMCQLLVRLVRRLAASPPELALLHTVEEVMRLLQILPFGIDLWPVQTAFYPLCRTLYPTLRQRAAQGEAQAHAGLQAFQTLATNLSIVVESM
jgi:alpha-amylase/alpha-mannosidase (GH57 family)